MKKENNAIVITSIISAVILIVAVLALTTFSPVSKNVVTVEGMSTIKAVPNLITVYYSIETKGTTSAEAKDANTLIFNKLKNAITAQGFEEDDLTTQSYNIYPNTYWENGKERQDGYKAYHSLKIEFSTDLLDKLSGVLDAGVNSGAGVSSINFELTQEAQNDYKAQALELASKDAQTKADAVASGFGKTAGKLVSVQVSDFGYYPWNLYASSGRAEDSALAKESVANIQPSEQEITGRVSATFKLV
jgi:hypothetical protein